MKFNPTCFWRYTQYLSFDLELTITLYILADSSYQPQRTVQRRWYGSQLYTT